MSLTLAAIVLIACDICSMESLTTAGLRLLADSSVWLVASRMVSSTYSRIPLSVSAGAIALGGPTLGLPDHITLLGMLPVAHLYSVEYSLSAPLAAAILTAVLDASAGSILLVASITLVSLSLQARVGRWLFGIPALVIVSAALLTGIQLPQASIASHAKAGNFVGAAALCAVAIVSLHGTAVAERHPDTHASLLAIGFVTSLMTLAFLPATVMLTTGVGGPIRQGVIGATYTSALITFWSVGTLAGLAREAG